MKKYPSSTMAKISDGSSKTCRSCLSNSSSRLYTTCPHSTSPSLRLFLDKQASLLQGPNVSIWLLVPGSWILDTCPLIFPWSFTRSDHISPCHNCVTRLESGIIPNDTCCPSVFPMPLYTAEYCKVHPPHGHKASQMVIVATYYSKTCLVTRVEIFWRIFF